MVSKDSDADPQQQKKGRVHRVFEQARGQWEDAERRIRAAMRIHPRPKPGKSSFAVQPESPRQSSADPDLNRDMAQAQAKSPAVREPNSRKNGAA